MINDLFENVVFKECIILHEFNELLLTFGVAIGSLLELYSFFLLYLCLVFVLFLSVLILVQKYLSASLALFPRYSKFSFINNAE